MNREAVAQELVKIAKSLNAGIDLAIERHRVMQSVKELGREIVRFRENMRNTGLDRESDQFYLEATDLLNKFSPLLDKYAK
jgi:hypothetical protein